MLLLSCNFDILYNTQQIQQEYVQTELIVCHNKVLLNLHMRCMEAIQLYIHFQ